MTKPSRRPALFTATKIATVGVLAGGMLVGGLAGGKAAADDTDWFSNARLAEDCDGIAQNPTSDGGTGESGFLDGCHYEESSKKDFWRWTDMDNKDEAKLTPINNCAQPADSPPATQTYTYTHTTTTSWGISGTGTGNLNGEALTLATFGITPNFGESTANAVGSTETMSVPGQKKGTWAVGQKMHHSEGRIRVNYSTPVGPSDDDKHYIWYINGVSIDTPYTNDNVGDLSGGTQSNGSLITQMAPDTVNCDGQLLGELNPTYEDTDGSNPPTDHISAPPQPIDSKAVAP